MIIHPHQLDLIRTPGFAYDAAFLQRITDAIDDFIQARGLIAAGASPGRLTEIIGNHALVLEILQGARRLTTPADLSRADGIELLTGRLEALRKLGQEIASEDVAACVGAYEATLTFDFGLADRFDADWLSTVADGVAEYMQAVSALAAADGTLDGEDVASTHRFVGNVIQSALHSPNHDAPPKATVIARLETLHGELRDLLVKSPAWEKVTTDLLGSLATTTQFLRQIVEKVGPPPLTAYQDEQVRNAWLVGTQTIERVSTSPEIAPDVFVALDELQEATNAVRGLFENEGGGEEVSF